ncbi:MAG TPA: methyltransferase domain-containing protein [Pyrinomonadaceae bacterium]|nr:methyltransferase domain-containing protein [Pyrinomonadaceae bacterium]
MTSTNQSSGYEKQHRGTQAAYEAYFRGMDASMQQKVALTTAHFPVRGRIADMGSGSGRGTYDLACLYSGLELVGVDINPVSVERAAREFQRPNLSYAVGDISGMVFEPESLDGILDSSVLHHVTSFNNFDVRRVFATLDNQVAQLKTGGVIIIRDFVIPDGPERVRLDLPADDGTETGDIVELSTAALFERFAREWRSSVNRGEPVPFTKTESTRAGFARYEVALRAAAEFVLRKDYRADWATEVLEEYTYLSQSQFEEAFRSRGLRIVTSRPLWNPWIVQNRFEGKFHLSDSDGAPLPFPPTNYLIVGEKVREGLGVELREENWTVSAQTFLSLKAYRHKESGKDFELVERPHQTVDVLPWFESAGQLFVIAKKDFPRPVISNSKERPRLDRAHHSGYVTEPVSAIVGGTADEGQEVFRVLRERAGFDAADVLRLGEPFSYFTSPGGVDELVVSRLAEVRPRRTDLSFPNYTPFKDAGTVRELDATQVLRACHVGGMFDARLEINIYRLLRQLGRGCGPWIGAPIALSNQPDALATNDAAAALSPPARAAFGEPTSAYEPRFLSLCEGTFAEFDNAGDVLAEARFEYVRPKELSHNTLTALPVLKTERGVFVGVEHRDLPAAQTFCGSSLIAAAPAWRLPQTITHLSELAPFLNEALRRDFGLRVRRAWELGGAYFPTSGVTPEVVYPFAVEVEAVEGATTTLQFTPLPELMDKSDLIRDAHLLIAAHRLAHALQILA